MSTVKSYPARCRYAAQGILRGEDSRAMDDCFENYDGAYVVAYLMRRADKEPDLKAAIRHMFSNFDTWEAIPWIKTAADLASIPDDRLGKAAAQERERQRIASEEMWARMRLDQIERNKAHEAAQTYRTELTPAGEQMVIPGCERDAAPSVRQLSLF
jgi:hypothetical protein